MVATIWVYPSRHWADKDIFAWYRQPRCSDMIIFDQIELSDLLAVNLRSTLAFATALIPLLLFVISIEPASAHARSKVVAVWKAIVVVRSKWILAPVVLWKCKVPAVEVLKRSVNRLFCSINQYRPWRTLRINHPGCRLISISGLVFG